MPGRALARRAPALIKVAEQMEHAGSVPDPRGDAGEVPRGQAGRGDEAPQRSRGGVASQ
ncbi:MAG: hypothetical protein ACLR7Z_04610 [Bilophila wadsworthia]